MLKAVEDIAGCKYHCHASPRYISYVSGNFCANIASHFFKNMEGSCESLRVYLLISIRIIRKFREIS